LEESKDQDILVEQLGSQEKKKQTGPIADFFSPLVSAGFPRKSSLFDGNNRLLV
jgi:hypothetical protein